MALKQISGPSNRDRRLNEILLGHGLLETRRPQGAIPTGPTSLGKSPKRSSMRTIPSSTYSQTNLRPISIFCFPFLYPHPSISAKMKSVAVASVLASLASAQSLCGQFDYHEAGGFYLNNNEWVRPVDPAFLSTLRVLTLALRDPGRQLVANSVPMSTSSTTWAFRGTATGHGREGRTR